MPIRVTAFLVVDGNGDMPIVEAQFTTDTDNLRPGVDALQDAGFNQYDSLIMPIKGFDFFEECSQALQNIGGGSDRRLSVGV
ncbi:hypothetical protein [Novosphingobium sp. Chol11]|uniref:hypothetical protein n=1 Tax=Novosphingobium sp. Chol11 TaxID=1385763 RepID=UPI000BE2ECAD|nr:hypothetical protein [Novosphingobium sp. Chol11]